MPTPALSRELAQSTIKAVEDALAKGYPPPGVPATSAGVGAVNAAAASVGVSRPTVQTRLTRAKALYNLEPNWSLYTGGAKPGEIPNKPGDIQALKLQDEVKALRAALSTRQKEDLTRHVVREKILELAASTPPQPSWLIKKTSHKGSLGVPTLFLSDLHWGEVVNPSEVGYANAYDLEIAHKRLHKCVETTIHLLTNSLTTPSYDGFVLAFGGDMVTGNIHEELTATNDAPIMPTVIDLYGALIEVIEKLADQFNNVFIPCVTGNHGRTTKKIPSKERNATSYDWLVYCLLEKHFAKDKRVQFAIPDGSDCAFNIYNHRYLLTHGDQFRGGDGLIGPLGPVTRGRHKKSSRNSSIGASFDTLMVGHFHTLAQLPHLIMNGSIKGLDEYAYQGNFSFERPAQALWITHPQNGITFQMPVYADDGEKAGNAEWVSWAK